MKFLRTLFSSKKNKNSNLDVSTSKNRLNCIELNSLSQLQDIPSISFHKLVIIYKHSSKKKICKKVWKQFCEDATFTNEQVAMYCLDIYHHNELSIQLLRDYNILNQIPHLIVIQNNKLVHQASNTTIVPFYIHQALKL